MTSTLTVRFASIAWGLLSLWLAFMCFISLSMLGFPDGYISPYDIATKPFQEIMAWLVVAQGAYFLITGLISKKLRPASLLLQAGVAGVLVFIPLNVVESCPRWDTCSAAYQAMTGDFMDDGTGG
jgi:hypothetical protein